MGRHKKFSSIGNDLTDAVASGKLYKTKRKIRQIAVHCSFSPQGRGDDAHTIDAWHQKRWGSKSGLGYHYVVLEDGSIQKGRWVDFPGAHVKGHNADTIGIVRIGGMHPETHKAYRDATPRQVKSITKLLLELQHLYGVKTYNILGHDEFPKVNKSCPLMDMPMIRRNVAKANV